MEKIVTITFKIFSLSLIHGKFLSNFRYSYLEFVVVSFDAHLVRETINPSLDKKQEN